MIKKRLISLFMVLMIIIIPIFFNASENLTYAKENNELQINKIVKENGDGTYNITLDAKGGVSIKEGKKADIVIMMDFSDSMKDKYQEVKKSVRDLIENLMQDNDGRIRIALGNFSCSDYGSEKILEKSSKVLVKTLQDENKFKLEEVTKVDDKSEMFISQKNDLINYINSLKKDAFGGGTHTQSGIWTVGKMLEYSRRDANRYVIFFTDGVPKESGDYYDNPGYDIHSKNAQKEYYKNFIGYKAPTEIVIGGVGYEPKPETIFVDNNPKYKDVNFYSVGVFTNATGEQSNPELFLSSIQNVIEPQKYKNKYFTREISCIKNIFSDITNEIKEGIQYTLAKDVKIHDIVKKEFSIVQNTYKVTDLNGNEINLDPKDINLSKTKNGEDEITLKIADIIANKKDKSGKFIGGVKVSFDISKINPYFGGKKITTNVEADIKYKNPEDKTEHKQIYNIPQVDIPYKTGEITLENELENKKNYTFAISLFGNSGTKKHKYTVDLKGNKKTTMDFYLRNETTDISNNKDFTKNYFTEGLYDIEEIVPMNYKKYKVMIKDKNNNWVEFKKYINDEKNIEDGIVKDGKLFIGEGNSNIKIKIKNILSNDMYWNDKVHVENKLKYN